MKELMFTILDSQLKVEIAKLKGIEDFAKIKGQGRDVAIEKVKLNATIAELERQIDENQMA